MLPRLGEQIHFLAEKKTKETLKEVAMAATINKTRKTYW
jgi:hypothetical protein